MNDKDKQIILDLLNDVDSTLRGQEIDQPDAEEIWVRMKEIEMTLRAGIKPITITGDTDVHQPTSRTPRTMD